MKSFLLAGPSKISDDSSTQINLANLDQRIGDIERHISCNINSKSVLTMHEALLYTGLSPNTMYKLTSQKLIPHSKPQGKLIFFNRSELDNWMLQNPIEIEEINKTTTIA